MSSPSQAVLPDGQEQSQVQRIINTFVAPSKAFAGLDRSPRWWMAWLLLSIITMGFMMAVSQRIGFDQVAQTVLNADESTVERMEKMPPEQREQEYSRVATFIKVTSYIAPLMTLIYMAVVAGVMLGTFNFGLATSMRFMTMLAVVAYSWLPYIVSGVLSFVTLFIVDPADFRIDAPIASNLGALVDPASSPVLAKFLSGFDVFNIWVIVLMGIGVSANSKLKRSTAIFTVAAWYAVILLGKIGFAAIRS